MAAIGPPPDHIVETEIGDELTLYDPTREQVLVLNVTAADVWRLIDGERTLDAIVDRLATVYAVEPERIADQVADTIRRFIEAGFLPDHGSRAAPEDDG